MHLPGKGALDKAPITSTGGVDYNLLNLVLVLTGQFVH